MIANKLTVTIERKLSKNYSTQSVRIGADIELEEGDVFEDVAREWSERCKNLVREQLHPSKDSQETNVKPDADPNEMPINDPMIDYIIGGGLKNRKHPDQKAVIMAFEAPDQWRIKSCVNWKIYDCNSETLLKVYEPVCNEKNSDND